MVNADRSGNSIEMGAFTAQNHEPNGSIDSSVFQGTPYDGSRVYKLMIQIEKIRPKPCPKSKKFGFQSEMKNNDETMPSLALTSADKQIALSKKQAVCLICNEIFQSAQSLFLHKKKHHRFVCQICDAYCSTQVICDKHEKLHVSNDPILPHKCHLCPQKFDTKRNVRMHTRVMHAFVPPIIGKTTLKPVNNVRQSLQNSEKIVDNDCKEKTTTTSKRNETKNSGNYGAVTFTCRVCSKDFTTVEAAEAHTREHQQQAVKEHRCNICKKTFKNDMILNAHLAQHLSRALRCPRCPKAFINRATLRIHMRSHDQDN